MVFLRCCKSIVAVLHHPHLLLLVLKLLVLFLYHRYYQTWTRFCNSDILCI